MVNQLIAVVSTQEEGRERYEIGNVQVDCDILPKDTDNDLDQGHIVNALLADLWAEWREEVEHPDADSDFIDWLVANKPGFSYPTVQVIDAVISV